MSTNSEQNRSEVPPSRAYFESINGDLYLWRIGEITAEQALEGIASWVLAVEQGEKR